MPAFEASESESGGINISGGGFDPDNLRGASLLFDQLAYMRNSLVAIGSLEGEAGGLPGFHDCYAGLVGGSSARMFNEVLGATFEALDKRESGRWSLALGGTKFRLPPRLLGEMSAFKLKFEDALPLPDRTVPLDDVLNFRERRRDDLRRLRSHIEGIGLQVARDGFGGLAETRAYEDFLASLEDHSKAMLEANFAKRLASLEVKFNWDRLIQPSLGGGILALTGDWKTAAFAQIAGAISVESVIGLRAQDATPRPFDYVFKAGKEL